MVKIESEDAGRLSQGRSRNVKSGADTRNLRAEGIALVVALLAASIGATKRPGDSQLPGLIILKNGVRLRKS